MFVPGEKAAKQPRFYRLGLWGIGTAERKAFFLFVLSLISHLLVIKVTECFPGMPTLCLALAPCLSAHVHAGRSGRAASICLRETSPLALKFWEGAVGLEPWGSSLGRGAGLRWWGAGCVLVCGESGKQAAGDTRGILAG